MDVQKVCGKHNCKSKANFKVTIKGLRLNSNSYISCYCTVHKDEVLKQFPFSVIENLLEEKVLSKTEPECIDPNCTCKTDQEAVDRLIESSL